MVSGAEMTSRPAATEARAASSELAPATLDEAAAALAQLARDRRAVAFAGGDTEPWPVPAPPAAAVLRTTRLDRIREHAPADQIVIAEAGLTLAALQRHLAPHRQRLALDPPLPERATLGGIVAAGSFGPRRTRTGAVRDLIIGVTLVRADGTVARGGGKVVKNVAGFDLPRLLCGSQGTLGLVAELAFRLHPLPERSETVTVEAVDAAGVWSLVRAVREAQLEPAAVAAFSQGERFLVAFRFEGFGPGVRDQVERLLERVSSEHRRGERLEGEDEAALWARHDELRTSGNVRAKATFLPANAPAVMAALRAFADALGGGAILHYPTLGIAFVTGTLQDAGAAAQAVATARRAAAPGNGALVLGAAPASLRDVAGVFGVAPPALELMRRLKAAFDPEGRLAPGRLPEGSAP
jgi:glycolate oxidase FAD binding subunit